LASDELFCVSVDAVRVVTDEPSARAFACALEAAGALALDAEWLPDTEQSDHPPSLLQIAVSPAESGERAPLTTAAAGLVWLLDVESLGGSAAALVDAALERAFATQPLPVLGFGLQADLDKLALLRSWRSGACGVRRAVDVRDACARAAGGGGRPVTREAG